MNSLSSSFLEMIQEGENARLELKETAQPLAVARVVVSFLNSQGGILIIGVNEDATPVGIAGAAKIKRDIEKYLDKNVTPPASWSVSVENLGDKECLIVDVPPGTHYPYVTNGTIYVRRGTATVKATSADLKGLFSRGQEVSERWERRPAMNWTLDDLDSSEIKKTALALAKGDSESLNNLPSHRVMEILQLSNEGLLLNSAVVLFAMQPQIHLPQTRVRTVVLHDNIGKNMEESQVLEGHAFILFEKIRGFLRRNLPTKSTMNGMVREEHTILPEFVIREAILNALVHRDYAAFDGSISVSLFRDRLEIWNPGKLPKNLTPKTIVEGHISLPRNPDVAHVFYVRGLVERLGLGARRIVEECLRVGLPMPVWQEVAGGVRLTLPLTPDALRQTRSTPTMEVELNLRAVHLLEVLTPGDTITLTEYREHFASGVSSRTARRDLEALHDLGYLRVKGKDRGRVYVRVPAEDNR